MNPAAPHAPESDAAGERVSAERGGPVLRLCVGGRPDPAASNFAAVLACAAGVPTALIQMLDDGGQLRLFGAFGVPADWAWIGRTPVSATLAGLVIGNEHPIIIPD